MGWDNLRDAEGERNAKERAGRNGKLLTTIITAVVLNGALLVFTYPFIKDALSKNPSGGTRQIEKRASQSALIIEREIKQSVEVREDVARPPEISEAQTTQSDLNQSRSSLSKTASKSLKECIKPNNLIDNDVLGCIEGRLEKSW
jgi:hypothetical protein